MNHSQTKSKSIVKHSLTSIVWQPFFNKNVILICWPPLCLTHFLKNTMYNDDFYIRTIVWQPFCLPHQTPPAAWHGLLLRRPLCENHRVTNMLWHPLCKIGILIGDVHNAYPTKPRPQRSEPCEPLAICVLKYGVALLPITRPKRKAV
jgi:hypothetical protein